MPDLRCSCGSKLAEYDDYEITIKCRKCKRTIMLRVIDGRLIHVLGDAKYLGSVCCPKAKFAFFNDTLISACPDHPPQTYIRK